MSFAAQKPSPSFAQAFVVLSDMMTQKKVELPLAIGIGAKDRCEPVQSLVVSLTIFSLSLSPPLSLTVMSCRVVSPSNVCVCLWRVWRSSLPKKAVQDLGCILIPQQTRDYGPSYAKTGYLVVTLKDQKGGAPVRIEAVEGAESDAGESYFIIAKVRTTHAWAELSTAQAPAYTTVRARSHTERLGLASVRRQREGGHHQQRPRGRRRRRDNRTGQGQEEEVK